MPCEESRLAASSACPRCARCTRRRSRRPRNLPARSCKWRHLPTRQVASVERCSWFSRSLVLCEQIRDVLEPAVLPATAQQLDSNTRKSVILRRVERPAVEGKGRVGRWSRLGTGPAPVDLGRHVLAFEGFCGLRRRFAATRLGAEPRHRGRAGTFAAAKFKRSRTGPQPQQHRRTAAPWRQRPVGSISGQSAVMPHATASAPHCCARCESTARHRSAPRGSRPRRSMRAASRDYRSDASSTSQSTIAVQLPGEAQSIRQRSQVGLTT